VGSVGAGKGSTEDSRRRRSAAAAVPVSVCLYLNAKDAEADAGSAASNRVSTASGRFAQPSNGVFAACLADAGKRARSEVSGNVDDDGRDELEGADGERRPTL
jgi:hypothetical protein